ncbi:MAG: Flp pilus assembly complex ATPase component TadA [Deltaproteobacteria bacterium]|nr:Flp pilus assembly complex ATPase component TadA [Deltaproteobacteria bacterium]
MVASFRFRSQTTDAEEGLVTERVIPRLIAIELGLRLVEIDPLQLDFKLVTESFGGPFAERHLVIAIEESAEQLDRRCHDPWNREVFERSRCSRTNASARSWRRRARSSRSSPSSTASGARCARPSEICTDLPDLGNLEQLYKVHGSNELEATDQPVVQAVWYLLNYAYDQRASDIHIEPKREDALVRMRIDGVLHRVHRLPKVVHPAIVSRVKTLSRLDIAERGRPQDGRFKTPFRDNEIELRVSTVPTAFGEKLVIRIFDPGVLLSRLRPGLLPPRAGHLRAHARRPNGMVLVVGPTGSGKTTTLYSRSTTSPRRRSTSSPSKTPSRWCTSPSTRSPCSPRSA